MQNIVSKISEINKALELFEAEQYRDAADMYKKMSKLYKSKIFDINIEICLRRARQVEKINSLPEIGSGVVIVSLTSYGSRVRTLHKVINTLLNQTYKNYIVLLWLAEDEFPKKDFGLPHKLNELAASNPDKFHIAYTKDLKSYKKIIPTLKNYANHTVVTADDDIYYREDWLECLIKEHKKYPDCIIAHRTHRMAIGDDHMPLPYANWRHRIERYGPNYLNFFTGAGGVLYPKGSLHKNILKEDLFLSLAPSADDIWLWANALLNKTKILVPKNPQKILKYIEGTQEHDAEDQPLHIKNVVDGLNDRQLKAVIDYFPSIKKIYKDGLQKKKCHVVFVTDQNYLWLTVVAIYSMFESKFDETEYVVHIVLDGVEDVDLIKATEEKLKIKIDAVHYDSSHLKGIHRSGSKFISANETALIKFRLGDIFKNLNKIIYLDSDVYVQRDLGALYSIDLKNKALAAAPDTSALYSLRPLKHSNSYFNSGVMLMNLDFIRAGMYAERLIEEKKRITDTSLMDQDVLNIVFSDNKLLIHPKYNLLYTNLIRSKSKFSMDTFNNRFSTSYANLEELRDDAAIVHVASKDKPWIYNNVPLSSEWMDLYKKTHMGNIHLERVSHPDWLAIGWNPCE